MDPRTKDFMDDPNFITMLNILKADPSKLSMYEWTIIIFSPRVLPISLIPDHVAW